MQAPWFVRPLTEKEQAELEAGRRSSLGFTVRRSHLLLASAQGQSTPTMAHRIGWSDQTVRNAIADVHQRGLAALQPKSSRPHTTHEVFDEQGRERLRALWHQRPRHVDKDTSIWTLELAAEVSDTEGMVSRPISGETIRNALTLLGVRWKRAKHGITSVRRVGAYEIVRREVAEGIARHVSNTMIESAVPSAVLSGEKKPSDKESRSRKTGIKTVRKRCICQHQDGKRREWVVRSTQVNARETSSMRTSQRG